MSNSPLCPQCSAKGLAIFPARYTVVPKTMGVKLPGWANSSAIVQNKLIDEFNYALRVLRAGYIYLYFPQDKEWQCYTVTIEGLLKKQTSPLAAALPSLHPTPPCPTKGHSDTALHYIVIENAENYNKAYIAFSEHKWTSKTLKAYKDDEKKCGYRMQEINPAAMLKGTPCASGAAATAANIAELIEYHPKAHTLTNILQEIGEPEDSPSIIRLDGKFKPSGNDSGLPTPDALLRDPVHSMHPVQIELPRVAPQSTPPYKPVGYHSRPPLAKVPPIATNRGDYDPAVLSLCSTVHCWAQGRQNQHSKLAKHMTERATQPEGVHMIALWDAMGIVHELNGYMQAPAGHVYQYKEEYALEIYSLTTIAGLRQTLHANNTQLFVSRSANHRNYSDNYEKLALSTPWAAQEIEEMTEKSSYMKRVNRDKLDAFKAKIETFAEDAKKLADKRAESLLKWLESPLFFTTLESYDQEDEVEAIWFEIAMSGALTGLHTTTNGKAKLDQWAKGSPTDLTNLLWRTIAQNQAEVFPDLLQAVKIAEIHKNKIIEVNMVDEIISKTLSTFAKLYKSANTIYNDNKGVEIAFGREVLQAKTYGTDKLMLTFCDGLMQRFSMVKITDTVSEKILQYMLGLRAYVHPDDVLALIKAEAQVVAEARLEKYRAERAHKKITLDSMVKDETKKAMEKMLQDPEKFQSQAAKRNRAAWEKLKEGEKGPKGIKDARLATLVGVMELINFRRLFFEARDKKDIKTSAIFFASGLSLVSVAFDLASVPAKMLEKASVVSKTGEVLSEVKFYGKPSFTYQQLKAWGGAFAGAASLIGTAFDSIATYKYFAKGNVMLGILYGLKTIGGTASGLIGIAVSFSYSVKLLSRLPLVNRYVTWEILISGVTKVAGTKLAISLVGRRIALMVVGYWASAVVMGIQVFIWAFVPNELDNWVDRCSFGKLNDFENKEEAEQAYNAALKEVGLG